MEQNANLTPNVTHQPSLLGGAENIKLLFDEELDSRRETLARQRAWEAISLDLAQTASRRAQNAATFDHAINAGIILSGQVGTTSAQQTTSPVRTASGDNLAAGASPANRIVDETGAVAAGGVNASVAEAALGNVTAQLADLVTQVAGLAALIGQIVTNAKQTPTV